MEVQSSVADHSQSPVVAPARKQRTALSRSQPLSPRSAAKRRKATERIKFGILQALVNSACERYHVDFVSSTRPLLASGTFGSASSCSNADDGAVDSDQSEDEERKTRRDRADRLRLRKRTRCGRDHLLKRTLVLVKKLRQTYDDLKRAQAPQIATDASTPAISAGAKPMQWTDLKVSSPSSVRTAHAARKSVHGGVAVPVSLSARCFLDASEARYLCRVHPDNVQHRLVDCNSIWSQQMHRPKDQLVGQLVRDLFSPASWMRFTVGIEMLRTNGVIMVRNVPSYKPGLIVDALVWGEFTDRSASVDDSAEHDGVLPTPSQVQPSTLQYVQIVEINPRPFQAALAPSFAEPMPRASSFLSAHCDPHLTAPPCEALSDGNAGTTGPLLDCNNDALSIDPLDSNRSASGDSMPSMLHTGSSGPVAQATVQAISMDHDLLSCDQSLSAGMKTNARVTVPVQCAVYLPLHQPDYADPEVCISPWRIDGTDRATEVGAPSVVKRSQLARILHHCIASAPDLLSPCPVQPSVQPAALDGMIIHHNMRSMDACRTTACGSQPAHPSSSNLKEIHEDAALEPTVRYFQVDVSCT